MSDTPDQFTALQAAEGEAKKVRGTHGANGDHREVFERRSHGQQRALQTLAGQQDRGADQKRCNG